jgi:single-stranded-DNA-specific exonuclease
VKRIADGLQLHPVVASVLVGRGLRDEGSIRRHLDPRLADLIPPTAMAGLTAAVERIGCAVLEGQLIGVFGDYDVDGVSSAALLGDFLRRCDAKLTLRVARRAEGYGFARAQAEEMLERGCRLLVLADCGTSDHDAVRAVAAAGVDVVALDHHRGRDWERWPGLVLVNPHRPDCGFTYKGMSAVGLCFYAVASLRRLLEARGRAAPDPRGYLDLVALGTVADVAPLDGVNRILVARGLLRLAETERPGLRELLRICDLQGRALGTEEIGWRLGPRLNAPGRLGDAAVALGCLWEQDGAEAARRARECDAINEERKEIQSRIVAEALVQARAQAAEGQACLLVAAEGWHPGVIGIVASRLVEELERPAAVVALDERSHGRGSARSVAGIDLMELLGACAGHLERFGGHAGAAGFSVRREALEPLRRALHEAGAPRLAALQEGEIEIDGRLDLDRVDLALCRALRRLGPHGHGNPDPQFVAPAVRVEAARVVGEGHLAMALRSGGSVVPAIGFGLGGRTVSVGDRLDVVFVPEIENYPMPRVRVRLRDLRPAAETPRSD